VKNFIFIILFLCACGPHTEIEYHTKPIEQVREECWGKWACAKWRSWKSLDEIGRVKCDIYLAPADFYVTEACYEDIIEHERHHCYEGHDELPTPNCVQYTAILKGE